MNWCVYQDGFYAGLASTNPDIRIVHRHWDKSWVAGYWEGVSRAVSKMNIELGI